MTIVLAQCRGCGQVVYPSRLLCFRCGAGDWGELPCDAGVVEECTVLPARGGRLALVLASVRCGPGPVIVAALDDALRPGAAVSVRPGPVLSVLAAPLGGTDLEGLP